MVTIEIGTAQDYLNVASSIEQLSSIRDPKMLYAFYYRPMYSLLENGFTMFRCVFAYGMKIRAINSSKLSFLGRKSSSLS